MAITSARDKLRLKIGDTNRDAFVFNNDELNSFLDDEADDVAAAALAACESAAARFARAYDIETDGQKYARSQMHDAFLALAKQLRDQGVTTSADTATVTNASVTKVDGYSDDIANSEVALATSGRRPRFYDPYDPDVIP